MEDGHHHSFGIAQSDFAAARLQGLSESLSDIERDWHRPEEAVAQLHIAAHAFVVGFVHKAGERREAAIKKHLEVANLSGGKIPRREILGEAFGLGGLLGAYDEVDEFSTVRRDEMALDRRSIHNYGLFRNLRVPSFASNKGKSSGDSV